MQRIASCTIPSAREFTTVFRGTQRILSENICSEDDLRSRIFGTFVEKFLACLLGIIVHF